MNTSLSSDCHMRLMLMCACTHVLHMLIIMPLILVRERQMQKDLCESEVNIVYSYIVNIGSFRLARAV